MSALVTVDPEATQFPLTCKVGEDEWVIFHTGNAYYAIERWCPHANADLAEGTLLGDKLKCPRHGFIFRLRDGKGINCPGINVKARELKMEEGRLALQSLP